MLSFPTNLLRPPKMPGFISCTAPMHLPSDVERGPSSRIRVRVRVRVRVKVRVRVRDHRCGNFLVILGAPRSCDGPL